MRAIAVLIAVLLGGCAADDGCLECVKWQVEYSICSYELENADYHIPRLQSELEDQGYSCEYVEK